MQIEIKKLHQGLTEDFLHFFDITPHSERPNDEECKCYCVWWCSDNQNEEVFEKYLSTKEKRRNYAAQCIADNRIQGYLVYCGNEVVGWCNANTKSDCYQCFCWQNFMGMVHKDDMESHSTKVKSIFCFAVSPQMRGNGIATALLQRVCEDAKEDGFDYVEAYPNISYVNEAEDFMGPGSMYIKNGFTECYETDKKKVLRRKLK